MSTLTIRARVNETVEDGTGYPKSVTVTGAAALSPDTVKEIAQEAIDSRYGEYGHGFIALFNPNDRRDATDPDKFDVRVGKYMNFDED